VSLKPAPRRILVIKLRHIGDVLLLTPVFDSLRAAFPAAELYACVNDKTQPVLETNGLLKGVLAVPKAGWNEQMRFIAGLRRQRFDLVIDFTGSDRAAILTRLSGARQRWGYHRVKGFLGRNRLFTRTARRLKEAHVVEQQAALLREFGVESRHPRLTFPLRDADRAAVSSLIARGGPFVHVHPVSRLMVKTWPAAHLASLLNYLGRRGLGLVVTASADSAEQQWVRDLQSRLEKPALDLSGQLSLPQLGAVSERAALFLGVDSAPLHIAAAVGTPVIGIFGPSSEVLWGPWCEKKLVLSRDLDCRLPCKLKNTCPHIACLREMTAEMVIPQVDRFLASLNL
jgi:heptosyltransferase-3